MDDIEQLKKEVDKIKDRNRRVEKEKAWEVSWTRRISLIMLTYLVMVLAFTGIGVDKPLINAIIPTVGYFLSTLSINVLKNWWTDRD